VSGSFVLRLKPGLSRDDALNDNTLFSSWSAQPRPAFRDVFIRHYDSIRSGYDALSGAGVVVIVIGPSGFEGSAALAAKPDVINMITIGRHGHADLFLPQEPTMSLRQGAVIVYPRTEGEAVRFRVLDLRAAQPFEDERGGQFEALEAQGPVFLRAGTYAFFIFPKGPGATSGGESAESAWEKMPERTYVDAAMIGSRECGDEPRFLPRSPGKPVLDAATTLVLPLPGPVFEHEKLRQDGETPRGRLVVATAEREMTLILGETAVARGVLLGRYERCDGSGFGILSHLAISRVHALVIEIAGQLYAIDAGSTNGLWVAGERVRIARLVPGLQVGLAGGIAALEWSFIH
jgi:FHA domain